MKRRSATAARPALPALLDAVERGHTVEISRRGKVVAWLVPPLANVDRAEARLRFSRLLDAWRSRYGDKHGSDPAFFTGLRDRSENGR